MSLRPTQRMASPYSVSRQTSLSFRERPMASCPGRAPHPSLFLSRPCGGMITPRFHRASEGLYHSRQWSNRLTATFAGDSCYSRFPGLKANSPLRIPCLLSSGATRLVPGFFPTGASIKVLPGVPHVRSATARARTWAWAFLPRWHPSRACRTARRRRYPVRGFRPIRPASEGCKPLCTEVRQTRFNSQGALSQVVLCPTS